MAVALSRFLVRRRHTAAAVRGMEDYFPEDVERMRRIEACGAETARRFGFGEVTDELCYFFFFFFFCHSLAV